MTLKLTHATTNLPLVDHTCGDISLRTTTHNNQVELPIRIIALILTPHYQHHRLTTREW